MFFSSPSLDLKVIIFCLVFAFVISLITYIVSKKLYAALFMMSVLSNLVLYLSVGSELFAIYNKKWIVYFTLDYWPLINLGLFSWLIINFFRNKNVKAKNE